MSTENGYYSAAEVQEILGIGQTRAYELKTDPQVEQILGHPIDFVKSPRVGYAKEDIDTLRSFYLRPTHTTRLTVINHKGGVLKSTTAATLAVLLAERGHPVLAIDLDSQANLSRLLGGLINEDGSGVEPRDFSERNLFHVFERINSLEEVIYDTRVKNLFLAPASLRLAEIPFYNHKPAFLRKQLDQLKRFAFVIIDTPPSLSDVTSFALVASSDVIVPVEPSKLALDGMVSIDKSITIAKEHNPSLNVLGYLFTRVQSGQSLSAEIIDAVKARRKVFDATIPLSSTVEKAHGADITIAEYFDRGNPVARAYQDLVKEVFDA